MPRAERARELDVSRILANIFGVIFRGWVYHRRVEAALPPHAGCQRAATPAQGVIGFRVTASRFIRKGRFRFTGLLTFISDQWLAPALFFRLLLQAVRAPLRF